MESALLSVRHLVKEFPVSAGTLGKLFSKDIRAVHAVDDVTFEVYNGEILGLAGESGCGKTTTGRIVAGLETPTAGEIWFKGHTLLKISGKTLKQVRKNVQMIFQNPYEALDPRYTVYNSVVEPLKAYKMYKEDRRRAVLRTLELVELSPGEKYVDKYPHELSGGERQRVVIARALVVEPSMLVADEPVSMLDASIRAGVLNLIKRLRDELHTTCLLITHDLSVSRYMCDRIAIMYLGRIVEIGPTDQVVNSPKHPYTKALIEAVPEPDPSLRFGEPVLSMEIPSSIDIPRGCRFASRCPIARENCREIDPEFREVARNQYAACLYA